MNHNADQNFFERLHQARAHGAFNDRLGTRLSKALWCDPNDSLTRELLENRLRRVEQDLAAGRLPPFPQARLLEGNLVLGQDLHGVPIRIFLDWLCSGLLTVANTGAGKSNLIYWIVSQLAFLSDAFATWLFEPYKTQLRLLLPIYQRAGKPLVILPWQDWRTNLLQCPLSANPNVHATTVVDVLVRNLNLPGRATSILRQAIHELYERFGVKDGSATRFPTLFHLFEYIRLQKDLNAAAKDAILDRLGSFLVALTPACGAWTRAWNHDDLLRYSIVFELRGAAESVRSVLPQSLLFGVFHSRIATGLVNCPLQALLVFDDGQRVFSDRFTNGGDMSPLDELAGIIRGAGIGLWPIVQTTVGFSNRLRPNLAMKLFGRLGCHEDYATLAADCGLNSEQVDYLRHRLVPGTFVGQVGLGNYTHPFIFRVPQATIPAALSDSEVHASQLPLDELPTEFADEFAHWTPHPVTELNPEKTPAPAPLAEIDLRVLQAVVAEPGKSVTHYCRQTRLNGKRLAEVRERLIALGFIREHRVASSPRGRAAIVIEPLPAAYQTTQTNKGKL